MNSLQSSLDERKGAFLEKAPQSMVSAYDRGVQEIIDRNVVEGAKHRGDAAPDFALRNAVGGRTRLSDLLQRGPVVLTWYRGGWCPYCNITLRALQDALGEFKRRGATLVALTPETPDHSLSTAQKHALEFEVLNDTDNLVARSYGLVFRVPDYVMEHYNASFSLSEYNGNDTDELPLAATYVVGRDGVIAYEFLHQDYRFRAEPAEIIEALERLTAP